METRDILSDMLPIGICAGCEPCLDKASIAMRRHVTAMDIALYLLRKKGDANYEEGQREASGWLVQSLQEAQSAWDAYCEHLKEHGLQSK